MTKRKSDEQPSLIFILLSKAYDSVGKPRGVRNLASVAFELIAPQFSEAAAEAQLVAYDGLIAQSRRYLRNLCARTRESIEGHGTQELTYDGHLFAYLNPAYMVARGDDSYAVAVDELTADEYDAIISRLESEAQTKAAEADELRVMKRLRFGGTDDRPSDGDVFQPSAP